MFLSQAKHALTTATKKALSRPGNRGTEGGGESREEELRSGIDSHDSSLLPTQPEGRRWRTRGRSTGADTAEAEMISNPKVSTLEPYNRVYQSTVVGIN